MGVLKTLTVNGVTYEVKPVVPTSAVTLRASAWGGSEGAYSQVVTLVGVTDHTKVDLQPTPEQVAVFLAKTLAFVAENTNGVVTVYSIGGKPTDDYTIQVTMTEVEGTAPIRGNTVGGGKVLTVNGVAPDENGNIEIAVTGGGGDITDEERDALLEALGEEV